MTIRTNHLNTVSRKTAEILKCNFARINMCSDTELQPQSNVSVKLSIVIIDGLLMDMH